MKPARLLLAASVALQPVLLGGCVAAVVPVIAGGMVAKTRMDGKPDKAPKGEHRREKRVTVEAPAQAALSPSAAIKDSRPARRRAKPEKSTPPPKLAEAPPSDLPQRIRPLTDSDRAAEFGVPANGTPRLLTGLTALPAPGSSPSAGGASLPAFVRYALTAAQPKPGQPFHSALIDPATLTGQPTRPDCGTQPPAVVIDLDPGKTAFDLDDPPAAAPGLAEQLAALRAAGLTVLWQTALPVAKSERLYSTLAATGLDPDRTDRLLLARKAGESKQARRQAAARDWCIVALAGDSKGDFEEAFDYLRDPGGPIATALSANLGEGWFLIPQPIH